MNNKKISYKDSGVDIDSANEFTSSISDLMKKNFSAISNLKNNDLSNFAGLFKLDSKYKNPVLVSGTDGVGSKIIYAHSSGVHGTIGIDLVAMCVNDLLTTGAEPLFFLDYIATGKINKSNLEKVLEGIITACNTSGCVLLGGETAEMPDLYAENTYDLAGFSVGVVEEDEILGKEKVQNGDLLIGLFSSGIHSNGYTLVRKVLEGFDLSKKYTGLEKTLIDILLEPTKIYSKEMKIFKNTNSIHASANITGGGLLENVARVLPDGLQAKINTSKWNVPPIFNFLEKEGPVDKKEMFRTFNMGIGMVLVLDKMKYENSIDELSKNNIQHAIIGEVTEKEQRNGQVLISGINV
tara:strand:- start:1165 stop:2220 length:1056 start_codon:yes stop_codon:yes gene_type:complete